MISRTKAFLGEVRTELGKATWPWDPKEKGFKKYKQLYDSTVVVVIGMIFLGAYVSLTDLVLASTVGTVTGGAYETRRELAVAGAEEDAQAAQSEPVESSATLPADK